MNSSALRLLALAFMVSAGPIIHCDDWPQWRGPDRSNASRETGLLHHWPEEGPLMEWVVAGLGEGIASVSVAAGRLFTMGYREGGEFLWALDTAGLHRLYLYRIPSVSQQP